ncbi:Phage terminase, small subunit (plasmid) [Piscirickettsia salmonis]|uniref:hypothetical protein n=1 Tax=Piscirickettsia salmonis TaxID=1238 RepID=UPI0018ACAA37|nr:hypothetical protein [Piscirickettsia salmonis]QGP52362.1 Phage terminase, small subunit [Piscirickettsia salmonis]
MSRMKGQGRKPKPTKLKKITGNAGKRKLNEFEPEPVNAEAICPEHFDNEAKKAFLFAVSLSTSHK